MKKTTYTFLFSLFTLVVSAQNLVPNGSFEQYVNCPSGISQFTLASGWLPYTLATTDYLNACHIGAVGVPLNQFGNEPAAHGNAYAGIYAGAGYREYAAIAITPMQIGSIYEASVSVSLADNAVSGTNALGMYFFDNGPSSLSTSGSLNINAQVSFAGYGPIITKNGWVRLTSTI